MNYNTNSSFLNNNRKGENMTASDFWDFISTVEDEYDGYRKQIMKKFTLSAAETDILMFLANNPQYDTAADVSKIRKIPKSQVSVSVKSLCEKGILDRRYKSGNKKSIHLILTENAEPIAAYGRRIQDKFIAVLFGGLSDEELRQFEKLHQRMLDNIEQKGE